LAKTTPLTPVLAAEGAELATVNGWERADFFMLDPAFTKTHSFRFNEVFDVVQAEVNAVHTAVGLCEVDGANRIEPTGSDVHSFLERMICGVVPRKAGRVGLGNLLNEHGMVKGEATIANLPGDRVWHGSAAASEWHDRDWMARHIRPGEDVHLRVATSYHAILVLAGPQARAVMQAVSRADWSAKGFPWLSVRHCFIGTAPAAVMGVSLSGELAYEIHIPNAHLYAACLTLRAAGHPLGMRLFGGRAVVLMRLVKGYLH
jgi:dimethylglycine dehydrogenase